MKSKDSHKYFNYLLLIFFVLPFSASASVMVTEIMYDLSGADTGREWVEVTNTGSDDIDITGYRLAEGGTNHTLTLISGSATLTPGASAVIADNKDKFLIDWPNFNGTLFDSSFSLNNATDTVEFKNKDLATLDSAAYDKNGGAAGDGNSFHRVDSTLVPGAPNPGIFGTPPQPLPEPEPEPEPAPEPEPTPAATSTTAAAATSTSAQATTQTQNTSATSQTVTPTAQVEEDEEEDEEEPVSTVSTPATKAVTPAQPTSAKTTAPKPKTAAKSKTVSPSNYDDSQSATVADSLEVDVSNMNSLWLYGLGLLAVIGLGLSAVWYTRLQAPKPTETSPSAKEFEIEG